MVYLFFQKVYKSFEKLLTIQIHRVYSGLDTTSHCSQSGGNPATGIVTVNSKADRKMATLTLNTATRALDRFAGASKIRAHMKDGVMFIRPTHRASAVNLDKSSEQLVAIAGGKVELEAADLQAGTYGVRADKYGWFALVPGHTGRGPAIKVA